MKAHIETTITTTLILDAKEAEWLKNVMQNPLHAQTPSEGDYDSSVYRKAIFDALSNT